MQNPHPYPRILEIPGLGHFGRGHLGRGHYSRGHFGRGHLGRGRFWSVDLKDIIKLRKYFMTFEHHRKYLKVC